MPGVGKSIAGSSQGNDLSDGMLESERGARSEVNELEQSETITVIIIVSGAESSKSGMDAERQFLLDPLSTIFRRGNVDYEIDIRGDILTQPEDYRGLNLLPIAGELTSLHKYTRRSADGHSPPPNLPPLTSSVVDKLCSGLCELRILSPGQSSPAFSVNRTPSTEHLFSSRCRIALLKR